MRLFASPALLCLALMSSAAIAQGSPNLNFIATELPRPEWPQDVHVADMDGDGLLDIVVPFWSSDTGRQLQIFLQDNTQRFPAQASRIVEIRSEIVAVAFADLRPEPGAELLLFTGSSVFSLSTANPSYSGNLRRLFDWPFTAAVPNPELTRFLDPPMDANADGFIDLLLPGVDEYGWFTGGPDEQFILSHRFSTINDDVDETVMPAPAGRISGDISFNAQDGLKVDVSVRSGSVFEDFLQQPTDSDGALLEIDHWMPSARMAALTSAAGSDLVYLNMGSDLQGQLNIKQLRADGSFNDQADWRGAVEMRGDLLLLDVDGDGLSDVLRLIAEGSNWTASFFINQGGRFDFSRANQVMRFSGYDLRISANAILDTGGKPQLSVSYYTIPVVSAIRDASIMRTTLLFNANASQGIFNNRPDFMLEESFSASTVRGLSSPIVLDADLDADGRIDALYVTPEGALAAKRIDSSLQFDNTPFWQYVPTRSIARFSVQDMNADGRPDLILDHSNTITVLVSAP
jgi:hypothetical protein